MFLGSGGQIIVQSCGVCVSRFPLRVVPILVDIAIVVVIKVESTPASDEFLSICLHARWDDGGIYCKAKKIRYKAYQICTGIFALAAPNPT